MSSQEDPLILIVNCLRKKFGRRLLGVMLFGSRARGDYKSHSDYDIFVLLKDLNKKDKFQAYEALREFRNRYYKDTSLVVLSREEIYKNIDSPIILNAFYEGEILYDKEGIMKKIKKKILCKMKELGMRRVKKEWGYTWEISKSVTPFKFEIDPSDPQEEYEYRLNLSKEHFEESIKALSADAYVAAIHEAQLAIENAAKAVIALFKPPSWIHNPAPELRAIIKLLSEKDIKNLIEELVEISEMASPYHAGSSYGNAERRLTPRQIYTREEAQALVEKARRAINLACEIIRRVLSKKRI